MLSEDEKAIWKKMFTETKARESSISKRWEELMEGRTRYSTRSLEDFTKQTDLQIEHKVVTDRMAAMIHAYTHDVNPLVWRLAYDGG
jgi:hypothetical protein